MNKERSEEELSKDPNMIELYDKDGKSVFIPRDEYKQKVLPETLKGVWNSPDELYSQIYFALNDGFYEEALSAAKRLKEIDTDIKRGYTTYGVALMHNKQFDEAKNLFIEYLNKYGDDAFILTYLAKTFDLETEKVTILEFLNKAINLDPNQRDTLEYLSAIINEDEGRDKLLEELQNLSKISGAWRPQLWLAREYLIDKRREEALELYKSVIDVAKDEPGALMKISGDLGEAGYVGDILEVVLPIYTPTPEEPFVGINILQAYLQTQKFDEGKTFLDKMYTLNRPDIIDRLDSYKAEFTKQ